MMCTMRDHSISGPTDYVIWGASGLLAVILGLGTAFFLWVGLHHAQHAELASGAVVSLSLGLVLIGLAAERPIMRTFVVLLAAMMLLSFAFGGPAFAHLLP